MFPKLESYLDALSLLFLTDESTARACEAEGVLFERLPKSVGTTIAAKVQRSCARAATIHDLSADIELLNRYVNDLKIVPRDSATILEKLNELIVANKVFDVCDRGRLDPQGIMPELINLHLDAQPAVDYGEFGAIMRVHLHEIREQIASKQDLVTIAGFEILSRQVGGFNPGRIGMLLGATGFGKTNLGLTLALRARRTMGVAYVNMEMPYADIARRMAGLETKTKHAELSKKIADEKFIAQFEDSQLFITSGRELSPNQIKSWVRRLGRENEIKLVIVDYDQALALDLRKNEQEWKALQRALADFDDFAKEANCFILVLAQLNRDGEVSASHRATFKAHSVLHFHDHPEHGPVIEAKKNRHGRRGASVAVTYDPLDSLVVEREALIITNAEEKKPKAKVQFHKPVPPRYVPSQE